MEHKYIRNQNNPGAVINTDVNALKAYKTRKQLTEQQRQEFEDIKNDVVEIKQMLAKIIEGYSR